jgi:hypothetical protein
MKIEGDLKLAITRIEDSTDHEGYAFLKAKGYCSYKTTTPRGRRIVAYDQFTSIRLRPINQEQYETAKERLFNQQTDKPCLKIVAYDCELHTNMIGGKICPILEVKRWDFIQGKLFRKKELLEYGKDN